MLTPGESVHVVHWGARPGLGAPSFWRSLPTTGHVSVSAKEGLPMPTPSQINTPAYVQSNIETVQIALFINIACRAYKAEEDSSQRRDDRRATSLRLGL